MPRLRLLLGSAILVQLVGAAVAAQEPARLVARYGDADGVLYKVNAAATFGDVVAVVTAPAPAVHVFAGGSYASWGREGGGPSELAMPTDVAWTDSRLHVLDQNNHKIVSYDTDGSFVAARSLHGAWANSLHIAGGDTIIGTFTPMAGERAVVRIRGAARDTLLRYNSARNTVRLEAEGAPSLTVAMPFSPVTVWTRLPDGAIAHWNPAQNDLRFTDRRGRVTRRVPVPGDAYAVTDADRAWWFDDAIPSEFMGRRGIFEPLRRVARETVRFPQRLPSVLELEADPAGGVWLRRTTSATGEVWSLVDVDGRARGSLRLPRGRTVLTIGEAGLVALATDDLGVELVEVYARPEWTR